MGESRFDELSKALARGAPRRTILKLALALPLAGLIARQPTAALGSPMEPVPADSGVATTSTCTPGHAAAAMRACDSFCRQWGRDVSPALAGQEYKRCLFASGQCQGACFQCGPEAPSNHPDLCTGGCCPPSMPTCCFGKCIDPAARTAELLTAASAWLGRHAPTLDALEGFPTTGVSTATAMAATLMAAAAGARTAGSAWNDALRGAADAALQAAQGDAGLLLARILDGFAAGDSTSRALDGAGFAAALDRSVVVASGTATEPAAGTALAVLSAAAAAAREAARSDGVPAGEEEAASRGRTVRAVVGASVAAARAAASARTAVGSSDGASVADAGGLAVALVLEGVHFSLRGRPLPPAGAGWIVKAAGSPVS